MGPAFLLRIPRQLAELAEQLLDHLRVVSAHDDVARLSLGQASADGGREVGANLRFRKRIDKFVEGVAADHRSPIQSVLPRFPKLRVILASDAAE